LSFKIKSFEAIFLSINPAILLLQIPAHKYYFFCRK
jgi:hypothetical protein